MRQGTLLLAISLATLSATQLGCATAFRGGSAEMRVESMPQGGTAQVGENATTTTPGSVVVPRHGTTPVTITKEGYATHRGNVKKPINGGWLTVDIITCAIPVALCIPLLVDAISGAWLNVPDVYTAKLDPAVPGGASGAPTVAPPGGAAQPAPPAATARIGAIPPTNPPASMSEADRKSAARAAFGEGLALQEKGDHEGALSRFQTAQKLFDAPTHIFRIGQSLASMGKLVEAAEVYEVLTRRDLAQGSPEAFREAQATAGRELEKIRPRIPTVRVQVTPNPDKLQGLVVSLNGVVMPNELIGIARPVNPGVYKVSAAAKDYPPTKPIDVDMKEGTSKTVELKLTK